ncbi:MAG TPA: 50S ribosomal protein L6 [Candidatus Bipolaricaulota bacterium]|nr:50S ribosomal protein L6 [Candidatus Bipolaricaulota bacterium]
MSRIGKKPIEIPNNVQVSLDGTKVSVKGPKGELFQEIHQSIKFEKTDNELVCKIVGDAKKSNAFWGLYRSLVNNMIVGVTEGFEKKMEINGVGYKANVVGKKLTLNVGYSHPVEFELPEGIDAKVDGNVITISGIDKQLVGEVAANIRKVRKPEPYKGKGIKYVDEVIIRKAGKTAKSGE